MTEQQAEAVTLEQRAITALQSLREKEIVKLAAIDSVTEALTKLKGIDFDYRSIVVDAGKLRAAVADELRLHRARMRATEMKHELHVRRLALLAPELACACPEMTAVTR